ncbi:MAG TPA: hypothetical protein VMU75_12930 [Acidimicrobiales bacterium]|nr:hypothetical protein [Acidimicrobiales bacterium]
MPKLQRFEGTDPAEVRARIRTELGPDATIVRAGRERSGGVLGFFEREVFVIEVEAPGDGAQAGRQTLPEAPRREAAPVGPAATAPARRPAASASPTAPPAIATNANLALATALAPSGLDSAVEATADVVSIRGERFDDSFSFVLKEAEATLAAGNEEEVRRFTPRLLSSAPVTADAAARPAAEQPPAPAGPAVAPRPFGRPPRPRPASLPLAPEYERVLRQAGIFLELTSQPFADELEHRSAAGARAGLATYASFASAASEAVAPVSPPIERSRVSVANDPVARVKHAETDTLARIRLSRLGLPAQFQPDARVAPLEAALLDSLRHIPAAPALPDYEDAVVLAIGGEGSSARLAQILAERLGIREDGIVTMTAPGITRMRAPRRGQRVSSALGAASAVAERRSAGMATVIAYELTSDATTAALLVAVTHPDATWAALPASLEPSALSQIDRVAHGIDALALYDLDDADRPACLLGAATPVALLDWREATPLTWAARLAERAGGGD